MIGTIIAVCFCLSKKNLFKNKENFEKGIKKLCKSQFPFLSFLFLVIICIYLELWKWKQQCKERLENKNVWMHGLFLRLILGILHWKSNFRILMVLKKKVNFGFFSKVFFLIYIIYSAFQNIAIFSFINSALTSMSMRIKCNVIHFFFFFFFFFQMFECAIKEKRKSPFVVHLF